MNSDEVHSAPLTLKLLPDYASFLLTKKLDEFVDTIMKNSFALNIPLIKYFESMGKEQLRKMSYEGNTRLLTALKDNLLLEYIESSKRNWLSNQLPMVTRDQIIVDDIALINYARKKTFGELIPHYTVDSKQTIALLDEIDQFILAMDSILYKTYIGIQQNKLSLANDALQKRESQLLEAQSLTRIGSFEWDLIDSKHSTYTPEVFKIFEMSETSNLKDFLQDVHPDDRLKLQGAIEKALQDGSFACEYRYAKKNIAKVLFSRGRVIKENGTPARMVGTVADVTDNALLIQKLQESEELSKQAQALTHTGNWKWTTENDVIEWSDEMYRIYGLAPQAEKITFERFLSFIYEEDRNRRVGEIMEAMKTGVASDYLMRIITVDGNQKVLKGKCEILLDENKVSVGMLGTCQDITNEHKLTAELKRRNEELTRKNRDLESFNFIASHDLQEPLRKIQLYSNRVIEEGDGQIPEHLTNYFHKIAHASGRMQKMIVDFLTFYHGLKFDQTLETIDLNELINTITGEIKDLIENKKATITTVSLPALTGIKQQLSVMLKHLIVNALKFSDANIAPEVTISGEEIVDCDKRPMIKLSISDNGIGFDQKYANRIFELFQRLNNSEQYSGSGIGLSLCKKIAEDHGGKIDVLSAPGKGSTFSIYFPKDQENRDTVNSHEL